MAVLVLVMGWCRRRLLFTESRGDSRGNHILEGLHGEARW